jgi:hypothetical protein
VEAARDAGATIVHAPISYVPDYRELALHAYGILKARGRRERLREGRVG